MSMNIVPWAWKRKRLPIGKDEQSLSALQRQMNRVFNDFVAGSSLLPEFFSEPLTQLGERWNAFNPNVNVSKTDKALVVTVEVPGMDEKDIELSLTKDGLAIRGERKQAHEEKGEGGWNYVESSYGAFERVVPLSDLVIDDDQVTATSAKGIVTITLPFKESFQATPKKVSIRPS
jgi:HSP20 family protein